MDRALFASARARFRGAGPDRAEGPPRKARLLERHELHLRALALLAATAVHDLGSATIGSNDEGMNVECTNIKIGMWTYDDD